MTSGIGKHSAAPKQWSGGTTPHQHGKKKGKNILYGLFNSLSRKVLNVIIFKLNDYFTLCLDHKRNQ
jgi:hypothetical protein